ESLVIPRHSSDLWLTLHSGSLLPIKSIPAVTAIIIFFILHWYLSLFVQTFYLHRYAAHRMFSMSPFWEKFFHVLTFIAQGSSYLSPYAYGVLHRMHHAY